MDEWDEIGLGVRINWEEVREVRIRVESEARIERNLKATNEGKRRRKRDATRLENAMNDERDDVM